MQIFGIRVMGKLQCTVVEIGNLPCRGLKVQTTHGAPRHKTIWKPDLEIPRSYRFVLGGLYQSNPVEAIQGLGLGSRA